MASLEARRALNVAILDYMAKSGFNQTREVFTREILANPNGVAINSPEGFLLDWWTKFYERISAQFPEIPQLAADYVYKVAQTLEENVVSNITPVNPTYGPNQAGANISTVMPSPDVMAFSGPDFRDPDILDLLQSIGSNSTVPDLAPSMESITPDLMPTGVDILQNECPILSNLLAGKMPEQGQNVAPPRRMTSSPKVLETSKLDGMLPSASNSGYRMQQNPAVPSQWNARDSRHGKNLLMEANRHAPTNALPAWPEPSDAGNNRSHQGWLSDGVGSAPPVINQQVVLPSVVVPIQKEQFLRTTSSPQQEVLPNAAVQTLNQSGRKRKTSSSALPAVGQDQIGSYNASIYACKKGDAAHTLAKWNGISFKEIGSLHATQSKLLCCHFHSQRKLLATAGHERKVVVWNFENTDINIGEGHAHVITDIRFRPNSMVFATSSFDRSVMIWDAAKPKNPVQNLVGHAEHVMSIDFHPTKMDLLSSCDSNDEIRLWDVNRGDCKLILKGGSRQVRFQPRFGNLLASSTGSIINIFDVETSSIQQNLQGHVRDVRSICWDMSGQYMASVSEDSARIWCVTQGKCIHELFSGGNKFQSCTFHPGHGQLLVIGSSELLELWNPIFQSNRTWQYRAHGGIISSLADSPPTGMIASVSHDQLIKIWQ